MCQHLQDPEWKGRRDNSAREDAYFFSFIKSGAIQ